jgi:dipeptidyl aminopeptidase/acylaminoacyl peptidase
LMGLIKDADLYRCGVQWLGVTDIELMYTGTWYARPYFGDDYKRVDLHSMIGDLEKDAAQLAATSPLQQAARIRRPLLMAYGGDDRRVPLHHGKKLYEAVRLSNRQLEWVMYNGEGHGWTLAKNRIDFWQRVERFLNKHNGPLPAVTPTTTSAP